MPNGFDAIHSPFRLEPFLLTSFYAESQQLNRFPDVVIPDGIGFAEIHVSVRGTTNPLDSLTVVLNDDTTATNYHNVQGVNGTSSGGSITNTNNINSVTGAGSGAGIFTHYKFTIIKPSDYALFHFLKYEGALWRSDGSWAVNGELRWNNTTPKIIRSIRFITSGNIAQGCRLTALGYFF